MNTANTSTIKIIALPLVKKISGGNNCSPVDQGISCPFNNNNLLSGQVGGDLHGNFGYSITGNIPVTPNIGITTTIIGGNNVPIGFAGIGIYHKIW